MIWKNKGHEFDELYRNIKEKRKYYLFGAGDYGMLFYDVMVNEINIIGFVDKDIQKQSKLVRGIPCSGLDKLNGIDEDTGVIITISQYKRSDALRDLRDLGIVNGKDVFLMEQFLSVYWLYKREKVYFSTISFLPSTVCNLNCALCLNFNPFAKEYYVRDIKSLKADIDLLFNCIDRLMILHISGGEPTLYNELPELIRYISSNYGDRIDSLRTTTNGTRIPSDGLLQAFSDTKMRVAVDDYCESIPENISTYKSLLKKLDDYGVSYKINKVDAWINLAPEKTDYSNKSKEWLTHHFDECCQTWHELRDGKLYMCNYASYAQVAGLVEESEEDYFDLNKCTEETKKELIEYRLGYSNKGYVEFCKKCRGFNNSNYNCERPALQVPRSEKR